MKKLLAIVLALIVVVCSMTAVAFADGEPLHFEIVSKASSISTGRQF